MHKPSEYLQFYKQEQITRYSFNLKFKIRILKELKVFAPSTRCLSKKEIIIKTTIN